MNDTAAPCFGQTQLVLALMTELYTLGQFTCISIGERDLVTETCDDDWAEFETEGITNNSGTISLTWTFG